MTDYVFQTSDPRAVSHFECCSEIPGVKNPLFKVFHDFLSKWERECCRTESITLFFPRDVLFFYFAVPLIIFLFTQV